MLVRIETLLWIMFSVLLSLSSSFHLLSNRGKRLKQIQVLPVRPQQQQQQQNHHQNSQRQQQFKVLEHQTEVRKMPPVEPKCNKKLVIKGTPVTLAPCEVNIQKCYRLLVAHGGKPNSQKKEAMLTNCLKIYHCPEIRPRICLRKQLLSRRLLQLCKHWRML